MQIRCSNCHFIVSNCSFSSVRLPLGYHISVCQILTICPPTACCWSLQIQLLMQIIINRIAFLMAVPGAARSLKWSVFLLLLLVNISVMVIWTPAHLQLSPRWIHINDIWDRVEKVIFCIIDLSLNVRFMYLVRSRLIKSGLSKYIPLYRLNLVLVCFSMCLDVST